jgi:hypothetical protein
MKNESTLKTALRILSLLHTTMLLVVILAFASGCTPDKPAMSPEAFSFKTMVQTNLDLFTPELSDGILKKNRKKINSALDRLYAQLNGSGDKPHFFLALLDSHGVTITSRSQTAVSGAPNYANYQVVAHVLQKKRIFTSSLYLQGGGKVYIICAPLFGKGKLSGVIVIGINSEFMHQSGLSEKQFMSLNFVNRGNGTP